MRKSGKPDLRGGHARATSSFETPSFAVRKRAPQDEVGRWRSKWDACGDACARIHRAAAGQSAGCTSAQGRPAPAARAVSTWTHPPIASRPCTLVTSKVADIGGSYHTGAIQSALSTAPALGNDPAV